MCCQWVESERPKALIPCFNSILTLLYSPQHKNTVKFGGKLDDGHFEVTRAVRLNLFTTAFLTQYGKCTSSRLGNFQDTHTKNGQSKKGHLPTSMSNEVKPWDYRYQERNEAPQERHIRVEPQC
jgi:hypothetical protein